MPFNHRTPNAENHAEGSGNINSPPDFEAERTPGAFVYERGSGPNQIYRVTIPGDVRPGDEFSVQAGTRRVRVRCPDDSFAGHRLDITLPPERSCTQRQPASLTAPVGVRPYGGASEMLPHVEIMNRNGAEWAQVTVPADVHPGMSFTATVGGRLMEIRCPVGAGPGLAVNVVLPGQQNVPEARLRSMHFVVAVPTGVQPGQPFETVAHGQRTTVVCPSSAVSGQKIKFQLQPSQLTRNVQLTYPSVARWKRTIRGTDLKFQWQRAKKDEENFSTYSFVRRVEYMQGNDARLPTGTVQLVAPDSNGVATNSSVNVHNKTLGSCWDIIKAQGQPVVEKLEWFRGICQKLALPWEEGHVKIRVRRAQLLRDSVDAIMGLNRDDLHKTWQFEFLGEPAQDVGGLARAWFESVTQEVFDPAFGLWTPSANDQAVVDIDPSSGIFNPHDNLLLFRFIGRVLGRALFDGQIIRGRLVQRIYKHLLGLPVTFDDLKAQDEDYHAALMTIASTDDASSLCLDFTVTEEAAGLRPVTELIEGGAAQQLTNENMKEYLEANLKHLMLGRTKPQLTELLLGFYDVVPEEALIVFDATELEMILCGQRTLDLEDWKAHTIYEGKFGDQKCDHQVVKWFWEVVENFDQDTRARLLRFTTGSSGVPFQGFAYLRGSQGTMMEFTIEGVGGGSRYPMSHTCFNRLDLPCYGSKQELGEKLAVALKSNDFGLE